MKYKTEILKALRKKNLHFTEIAREIETKPMNITRVIKHLLSTGEITRTLESDGIIYKLSTGK